MTTYNLVHRLTIYAPKSQDATETTVLTPIAGAAHSDPFVVTTKTGIAGAKAYMDFPSGRIGGQLNYDTRRTTVGDLSVKIYDIRVTAGGSNASRWATAFVGDAQGRNRLLGCKVYDEESTDGGVTWSPYFTGRIRSFSLDDPLAFILDCKDTTDDLSRLIFTGQPHATLSPMASASGYAFMGSIMPIGLPFTYGNFQGFGLGRLNGTITFRNTGVTLPDGSIGTTGGIQLTATQDRWVAVVTAIYKQLHDQRAPRVIYVIDNTGRFGCFDYYDNGIDSDTAFDKNNAATKYFHNAFLNIGSRPTDPFFMEVPAVSAAVTFWISVDGAPSKDVPLYLSDVHPVQLWADLIDGKFSLVPGSPIARPLATRDSSAAGPWAPLIADQSFLAMAGGSFRAIIEQPEKANDWIEKYICQPYNLGYRIDGSGNVVPLDLRRKATISPVYAITDADCRAGETLKQGATRDKAYTAGQVTYYHDSAVSGDLRERIRNAPDQYPNVPPAMIVTTPATIATLNATSDLRDLGEQVLKIDARGLRIHPNEEVAASGQARPDIIQSSLVGMLLDQMAPFAGGSMNFTLPLRRTVTARIGDWVTVGLTKQFDPASNLRGGTRLCLVLGRSAWGLDVDLDLLDAGANAVAVAPTIGTPTISADDVNGADVVVTLNASVDPAIVQFAATATSVSARPDELSALWTFGAPVQASGKARLSNLPSGMRIWVRARSQPTGVALKLPSAWAVPSGTGYLDIGGITAPSALSISNAFANRVDLSWTSGDATKSIELFQTLGAVPGAWTAAMKILVLDPGSVKTRVTGLTALTQYAWGVRHRDQFGGASSMATVTTTLGSTLGTAPRPAGIDIAVRPTP